MNAMNIKEGEYKYDFFISTAYTMLSIFKDDVKRWNYNK